MNLLMGVNLYSLIKKGKNGILTNDERRSGTSLSKMRNRRISFNLVGSTETDRRPVNVLVSINQLPQGLTFPLSQIVYTYRKNTKQREVQGSFVEV